MATIKLRDSGGTGTTLTHNDVDDNFTNLNTEVVAATAALVTESAALVTHKTATDHDSQYLQKSYGIVDNASSGGTALTIAVSGDITLANANTATQPVTSTNVGTVNKVLTHNGTAPSFATPTGVADIAHVQTRTQNTYSAPTSGDGVIIAELNITMTPKKAGNKIILEWHFNGEVTYNSVWIVTRDGTKLADTTNSGNNRWAGIIATPYDNNTSSTPDNAIIRIIDENTLATATTYKLLCRSSMGTTHTVYLNRTQASTGADEKEASLSTGTATEVWV
jgi:hypothetical protein